MPSAVEREGLDAFEEIGSERREVLELAPAFWQATIADPSVQQRLDANLFRCVTLAEHRRAA